MRRIVEYAWLLAAPALLLAVVGVGPAVAQDAQGESSPVEAGETIGTERVVVADGHIDVGPRFVDGTWTLLIRDDTVEPSVWRHLPDVVLQATDAAVVQVPDDPTFSFLGPPGAQVWLLPQVQQPGILWPGWNTQDPEVATTIAREATWTLTGVDGPGAFVLFVNQDFGQPATIFDSRNAFPQETGIAANTHAHGNWVFTQPGVYGLAMEMSATTVDGDEVTASGILRVAVGDATDPQGAFSGDDTPASDAPTTTAETNSPTEPAREDDDPNAAARSAGDDGGSSGLWIGLAAVAVVLLGIGAPLAARMRQRGEARSPEEP